MSGNERWYERLWRTTPDGPRSMVSAALYFVVGIGGVLIAITADTASRRIFWAVIAVAFLVLGGTLVATLRARRKRRGSDQEPRPTT